MSKILKLPVSKYQTLQKYQGCTMENKNQCNAQYSGKYFDSTNFIIHVLKTGISF